VPAVQNRQIDNSLRWFPGRSIVTTLRYRGRDYRYRELFDALRTYCRGAVLDVGGGSFVKTAIEERVSFDEWTIVEPLEGDLPRIADPRVHTRVGDGQALDLDGNQFDTVLSVQVLEHVFEPIRMIEELYRVTKPGGHVVVMVPQTANIHHAPHHYQNLTRYWLDAAAYRLGAEVVEYRAMGGAWSTIASRVLLQYPGALGMAGYKHPGARRSVRFWLLFPVGVVVSAITFPLAMLMSLGDMEEEANNHLMVLRKPV